MQGYSPGQAAGNAASLAPTRDLTGSAYGSARALAGHLGHEDAVELLQETLDEESAADEKLTSIALEEIMPNAETGEHQVAR